MDMKKIVFAAMALAMVLPAAAQDTYESGRLLGSLHEPKRLSSSSACD